MFRHFISMLSLRRRPIYAWWSMPPRTFDRLQRRLSDLDLTINLQLISLLNIKVKLPSMSASRIGLYFDFGGIATSNTLVSSTTFIYKFRLKRSLAHSLIVSSFQLFSSQSLSISSLAVLAKYFASKFLFLPIEFRAGHIETASIFPIGHL